MRIALLILVTWLSNSHSSYGASQAGLQKLKTLFEAQFYGELYQPRKCGQNIMNFVNLADREGIDLGDTWIVQWTNLSFDFYGMVRGNMGRDGARDPEGNYVPGPRNWHHHVVLDYDGWIFDFDFTNSPRVLRANAYVAAMFAQQGELPNYEAEITSTLDYLRLRADHNAQIPQPKKVLLKNYLLDHWR